MRPRHRIKFVRMKKIFSLIFALSLTISLSAVSFPSVGFSPEGTSFDDAGNLVSASNNDYLQAAYDDESGIAFDGEVVETTLYDANGDPHQVALLRGEGYDFAAGDSFTSATLGISGTLATSGTFTDEDGSDFTINAPEGYLILVNGSGELVTFGPAGDLGGGITVFGFKLPLHTDTPALLFLSLLALSYALFLQRKKFLLNA